MIHALSFLKNVVASLPRCKGFKQIQKVLDFTDALWHINEDAVRQLARATESGEISKRPGKTNK